MSTYFFCFQHSEALLSSFLPSSPRYSSVTSTKFSSPPLSWPMSSSPSSEARVYLLGRTKVGRHEQADVQLHHSQREYHDLERKQALVRQCHEAAERSELAEEYRGERPRPAVGVTGDVIEGEQ